MKILVFDIGGTNIRYAVADGQTLGQYTLQPVSKNYRQTISLIAGLARAHRPACIVGGVAGTFNTAHTKLVQSTHLPLWVGRPCVRDLERAGGAKVVLENDCALAALGEAVSGAGRGARIVGYIGFGTGIGGARIVDQRIDANAKGFEPGHHIIDWHVKKHRHPSPHPGDWESFVSGTGIFFATGQKTEHITSAKIWRQAEERAAIGLINVAMFWSPDVIILGGSLMKKMSLTQINVSYRKRMRIFPQPPILKRAKLGDFSGLYGAVALAKQGGRA